MNVDNFKACVAEMIRLKGKAPLFDWSAVSQSEWDILFLAHRAGTTVEAIAESIIDGSVYEKYFEGSLQ